MDPENAGTTTATPAPKRTGALRTALDLALVFGVVALLAAIVLIVVRTVQGEDPLGGRELWIATIALVVILGDVAARAVLPKK